MTRAELIGALAGRFYPRFADRMAAEVLAADAVGLLYDLATEPEALPRAVRHKVVWRGAYVLERIFFTRPEAFAPYAARFCSRDFAACADPGARRSFAKTMAALLRADEVAPEELDRIAEAAAEWTLDPATKTAVRVWALEILNRCRSRVEWVAASWDDLLAAATLRSSPGVLCRLRRIRYD